MIRKGQWGQQREKLSDLHGMSENKSHTVGGRFPRLMDNNMWAKEDCIGDKMGFKRSY